MRQTLLKSARWLTLALSIPLATWADAKPIQIVALGDSNTAGLFVGKRSAFPALVEKALRNGGRDVTITNRGISGDTTAGMLSRLQTAVPDGTALAIVQGGYNDKRRGISPETRDANVAAILANLRSRGVKVVLCGLDGAQWGGIARKYNAVLVPGSTCYDVDNRGFDRLHMNRAGHRVIAQRLTPVLLDLLGSW